VGELFSSTEGNFTVTNHSRNNFTSGAVVKHGLLLRTIFHKKYVPVRIDSVTGDMWRDPKTGFAKRVPYEDGGEILVKLDSKKAWSGYWNAKAATEKKFMEDVFEKGDLYYRVGDALKRDGNGLWYFMDRLGKRTPQYF